MYLRSVFAGSSGYSTWLSFVRTLSNSISSARPKCSAMDGVSGSQKPNCLQRRRNESIRPRSAARQKPDQAGAAYSSLANTVALNTVCNACPTRPCAFSVRNAYKVRASRDCRCHVAGGRQPVVDADAEYCHGFDALDTRDRVRWADMRSASSPGHKYHLLRFGVVQSQIVRLRPFRDVVDFLLDCLCPGGVVVNL